MSSRPAVPPDSESIRIGTVGSSKRNAPRSQEVFPTNAFSPEGVDLTLLATWLEMNPEERLDALQEMLDFVALARRGRPSEAP